MKQKINSFKILHEVGIAVPPHSLYEALTDTKKLASWWTSDTRGSGSRVGDILEFWFGDFCQKFEVTDLQLGKLVKWKATQEESIDEWAGTEITFKLNPDEDQCRLNFSHAGWKSDEGMFAHCATKWAVFMVSLKELLENGKGHPAPDDIEINHD